MDPQYRKAYALYHLCVFLWGFTAIFGKIIALHEVVLVGYRMGITSLVLICIPALWKNFRKISVQTILQLSGIGVLVALHWIAFYGSIKASNISVALTCLATASFFVSIFEPLLLGKKFIWYELLLAIIVIPAIYLIFHFSGDYTNGIILGLISTVFTTIFSILNKKMIRKAHPLNMTFTEITAGFFVVCLVLPFYLHYFPDTALIPSRNDFFLLLLFSVLCTVVPFTLSLFSLQHISVFTASITLNLEPVYGIIMAIAFFHENEHLEPGFYAGTIMILAVVFINPFIQRRFAPKQLPNIQPGE